MKVCTQCGVSKDTILFQPRKNVIDGLSSNCRKCSRDNATKYSRTVKGVINTIYRTQKSSSKTRNMPLPTYTIEWLSLWLKGQPLFYLLYDEWVKSGYDKYLKPSVDRLDDELSYTILNIQLMSWRENKNKYDSDRKNGIDKKQNKKVLQFSKDNIFVASYFSLSNASLKTGVSESCISNSCNGKTKYASGFIWKYAKI